MNGLESPGAVSGDVGSFSSQMNGHRQSPEARRNRAKTGANGSDEMYFLRSSSKHRKKSQKQRSHQTRTRTRTRTSNNSLTDTSQYHVEHLSTFVLDRKDGMVTVDDGVRRLRLLDAKGKVWTQEVLLQVEEKVVSLIDLETKTELENFPVGSIQLCQAVMNACSYDSILALVCKESGQNKPDLHLFQCDDVKASLIHADVESAMMDAKGGKVKRRPDALRMILNSDGIIPPPPVAPAPEPPASSNQVDVKSRAAAWSAWTNEQQDFERQLSEDKAPLEVTVARVDRDVQILNRVLDDIEVFVTKLQKAAEAFGELAKRRRGKKGKKRAPGEGVLTLRSKPPAEEEFVDCLQKFKHAFNQLGQLKDHIQNPSAEDLVHFLFSPLRMVVQASGGVDLARSVVVPLLTRDAIDFLHAAGTAEERHLWVALGDGWTKCRLEWPKDQYFPPCVLRFRDGWEPPVLPTEMMEPRSGVHAMDDLRLSQELGALQRIPPADGYASSFSSSYRRLDQDGAALKHAISHRADCSLEVDSRVQHMFAKSKYDFVARNSTELSVLRDELVEVLDDRKQWWKVKNGGGVCGYVPNNILELSRAVDLTARGEPIYSHTIQLMMPKKEFELFKKQTTRTDFLPGKPVATPMPAGPAPTRLPTPPASTPAGPAPTRLPTPPLPPPAAEPAKPPPTPTANTASVAMRDQNPQRPAAGRRKSNMEEVQDELMHRLTLGRSAHNNLPLPARGGAGLPAASITYDSTPDDVTAWLQAKGFTAVTVTSLGVLTGAQLFSLNKDELRTVCPDDGARVFSQVTVQKAALERSSGSELQEIMRRRQEKLAASTCDSGVESFDEGAAH